MSDTPRTDSALNGNELFANGVIDEAMILERELAAVTAERDALKVWKDQAETNYLTGEPLAKRLRKTEAERDDAMLACSEARQVLCEVRRERNALEAERDALKDALEKWLRWATVKPGEGGYSNPYPINETRAALGKENP